MGGEELKSVGFPSGGDYSGRKINWSGIKMADNGWIVNWSEQEKGLRDSDHCDYISHDKLFTLDEEQQAWDMYKELKIAEMKYDKHRS